MSTVSHPDFNARPVAGHCFACPAGSDLLDMILCWLLHAIEKARGADERASKQSPRRGSRWRGTTERLSREPHVYLRSAVTRWPRCPADRSVVPIQKGPMNVMNAFRASESASARALQPVKSLSSIRPQRTGKEQSLIIKTDDPSPKPRPSPREPEPTWVQLALPGIDPA